MHNTGTGDIDSKSLFRLLLQYKNHIFVIIAAAALSSYVFTLPFFITPLYKSTVVLYPTSTNSISKALLSTTFNSNKDLLEFGEDEQTERMLQILSSNKIRDRIIEKFNLSEHYNISENSKYRLTRLYREYESKVRFRRTEYMAVKITVVDKDASVAANIANEIAELFDSTMNAMQKEVAVKAFRIVENEYLKLRDQVAFMEDSLNEIRRLGVHDYESQAEMMNQQLAIELAKGNKEGIKRLEEKLEVLSRYGGTYVSIRDMLEHERKQLSQIKAKYDEAKVDANENLPHKFVVTNAFAAERKSYPIRWLIMVIAVSSAFFLSIFAVIALDKIQLTQKKKVSFDWRPKLPKLIIIPQRNQQVIKQPKTNVMDNYFNNTAIVRLILKWKVHLAVITVIAAVLGAIFSGPMFITPLYKSEAVVYPANIDSYSEESSTEQMLQLLQSQDIIDSMIRIFNLAEHYKIDPDYKFYRTALLYEYQQSVKISKTPYEAVSIVVRDKDPLRAAKMVEEILRLYDVKVSGLHKAKYREVVDMYKNQLNLKKELIDSLQHRLYILGTEYGLIDYSMQSQEIMRGYLRTVYGNNAGTINSSGVNELKKNIEQRGGELLVIVEMLQHEARTFVDVKVEYEQILRFYNAKMTYSNIVSYPYTADKKAYPVRWIIVLISMVGALLLSALVIVTIENRHAFLAHGQSPQN